VTIAGIGTSRIDSVPADRLQANHKDRTVGRVARKIAVIGLGHVGLPVAIGFARTGAPVVGFDIKARLNRSEASAGIEPSRL
jgi:phosphoglycerate dehydrogenase-like enzyme